VRVTEIDIDIDLTAFDLSDEKKVKDLIDKAVDQIVHEAAEVWKNAADGVLHSTKRGYQNAIQVSLEGGGVAEVYMQQTDASDNVLANLLERGSPKIEIWRSTLLASNHKIWYYSEVARVFRNQKKGLAQTRNQQQTTSQNKGKNFNKNPPFIDIPNPQGRVAEHARGTMPPGDPPFRRLTPKNANKFTHPGFKPLGGAGLDKPLREEAIDFIQSDAEKIFKHVFRELNKDKK
jgi:hypothetical protein